MQPWHRWSILGLILLAAAATRLVDLGERPMTTDEMLMLSSGPYGERLSSADTANNPPLFPLLARAVVGHSLDPFWLRIPSMLLGLLAVALAFRIGRRYLGGDVAGLVAAAMIGLAPCCVDVSQKVRAYALAHALCLLVIDRALAARNHGRGAWHGLALSGAVAGWAHYLAPLVLSGAAVSLLRPWPPDRRRIQALAVTAGVCLALALPLFGAVAVGYSLRAAGAPGPQFLTRLDALVVGLATPLGSVWPLLVLLLPAMALLFKRRDGDGDEISGASVGLGVWLVVALGVPVLLAPSLHLQPDNLSFVALPAALLVGAALGRALQQRCWFRLALGGLALLAPLTSTVWQAVLPTSPDPARVLAERIAVEPGAQTVAISSAASLDLVAFRLTDLTPDQLEPVPGCGPEAACRRAGRFTLVQAGTSRVPAAGWWLDLEGGVAAPLRCRVVARHGSSRLARCPVDAQRPPEMPALGDALPDGVRMISVQRVGLERIDHEVILPQGRLVVSVAAHDERREPYARVNDLDLYYWSAKDQQTSRDVDTVMQAVARSLGESSAASLGLSRSEPVRSQTAAEPPLTLPWWWIALSVVVLLGGWWLLPRPGT